MFRHVRDIIGDDIAAFLARIRDAQRHIDAAPPRDHGARADTGAAVQVATASTQHADAPEISAEMDPSAECDIDAMRDPRVITLDVINA